VTHFLKAMCELKQRFQFLDQNILRDGSDAFINDFAVLEKQDGWYVPYPVFHADIAKIIDVHFSDNCSTVIVVREFFHYRAYHAAGPTPLCPKIYDYRLITFQSKIFEILVGKFYSHFFSHYGDG